MPVLMCRTVISIHNTQIKGGPVQYADGYVSNGFPGCSCG